MADDKTAKVIDYTLFKWKGYWYIRWDAFDVDWYSRGYKHYNEAANVARVQINKWKRYFYNQKVKLGGLRNDTKR